MGFSWRVRGAWCERIEGWVSAAVKKCWLVALTTAYSAFFPSTFYSARPMISTSKNSFSLFLPLRSLKNNKFPFPIFLWCCARPPRSSLSQISIESSFKKRVAPAADEEKITGGCHSDGEQRSKEQKLLAAAPLGTRKRGRACDWQPASTQRLSLGRLNKLIDSSLASQLMSPIKI